MSSASSCHWRPRRSAARHRDHVWWRPWPIPSSWSRAPRARGLGLRRRFGRVPCASRLARAVSTVRRTGCLIGDAAFRRLARSTVRASLLAGIGDPHHGRLSMVAADAVSRTRRTATTRTTGARTAARRMQFVRRWEVGGGGGGGVRAVGADRFEQLPVSGIVRPAAGPGFVISESSAIWPPARRISASGMKAYRRARREVHEERHDLQRLGERWHHHLDARPTWSAAPGLPGHFTIQREAGRARARPGLPIGSSSSDTYSRCSSRLVTTCRGAPGCADRRVHACAPQSAGGLEDRSLNHPWRQRLGPAFFFFFLPGRAP